MGAGARISEIAKKNGISLRKLAKSAGIPYNTLYSITQRDSGKISAEIAQKLAATLNIDINFLIYGSTIEKSNLVLDKVNDSKKVRTIMYRIKEVAQILGFTERAVRQWVVDGKIKAVKIMSEWRIPEDEVERLKRGEKL